MPPRSINLLQAAGRINEVRTLNTGNTEGRYTVTTSKRLG